MRQNTIRLGLVCAVLLAGAFALKSTAQDFGRSKMACMNNLKQIAAACFVYSSENSGWLPASIEGLKESKLIKPEQTVCPSAADESKPSYEIVLKGRITAVKDPQATIMVREIAASHNKKRHVAYADGHVDAAD